MLIVPNGHGRRFFLQKNTQAWITSDGDGSYTLWSYPKDPILSYSSSGEQPVILFNPTKQKLGISFKELNNLYQNILLLR